MKSLLLIFGFSVFTIATVEGNVPGNLRTLIDYTKQCMRSELGSLDDALVIATGAVPDTREGHCMVACIAEQIGFIKDGKFSPDSALEGVATLIDDRNPNKKKVLRNLKMMNEECKTIENEDRCELVLDLIECFHS